MKKIILILAAFLFTASLHAQDLPNTTVKQLNGKPIKFNQIFEKDKVTLVSFWATWCVPCKAEIKNIKDKLADWKSQADFNFLTVSIDDSRGAAQVKSYATSQGWSWPTYLDQNSDLKRSLNFQSVPFTMIVDQQGKIVYQHTGYEEGGEDEVFEKVKAVVNGQSIEEGAVEIGSDMDQIKEVEKTEN